MYVCCVGGNEISVAFLFLLHCFETFSFSPTWTCFVLLKKVPHFFILASSHRYYIINNNVGKYFSLCESVCLCVCVCVCVCVWY